MNLKKCYQCFQSLVVHEKKVEEHQSTLLEVYMPVYTLWIETMLTADPHPRIPPEYLKGSRDKKPVSLQSGGDAGG